MRFCVHSKTPSWSLSTPAEPLQFKWKMWNARLRTEQLSSASRNQQRVTTKPENEFRGWANLLIVPNDADKSKKAQHVKPVFPAESVISLFLHLH